MRWESTETYLNTGHYDCTGKKSYVVKKEEVLNKQNIALAS